MEGNCRTCGASYELKLGFDTRPYRGGNVTITEVPMYICDCDQRLVLGDGAVIVYYVRMLELQDVFGNVTVSMTELNRRYTLSEVLERMTSDPEERPCEVRSKMEWMKSQLGIETDEELLSKALSILNMAIQLEERGYTLKGYRNIGILEGAEHIDFRIRA